MIADVVIAGAGPAGSTCAALCSAAGLRVIVLERAEFPREKVCGDCLNPKCWPVFEMLGVSAEMNEVTQARIHEVEIGTISGRKFRYSVVKAGRGEVSIKRSILDALLAKRASALGAEMHHGQVVTQVETRGTHWEIFAGQEKFHARYLVAADGRNSTVARLAGVLPPVTRDRVALQAHLPRGATFENRIALWLLPQGYCGMADVGGDLLNVCLVSGPKEIGSLKAWASAELGAGHAIDWRSIAPLERGPVSPLQGTLLLVGDAARVVEPFTGEGIYYALATGALAARFITGSIDAKQFRREYSDLYAGRLWVNQLARAAVTHPHIASHILERVPFSSAILRRLTTKVVGGHL